MVKDQESSDGIIQIIDHFNDQKIHWSNNLTIQWSSDLMIKDFNDQWSNIQIIHHQTI